jgi:cytochrome c556
MKASTKCVALSALALAVGLYAGSARAQDAAAAVEARQGVMKAQGKDAGAIKAYVDGKGDLAAAQTAGADLVTQIAKVPGAFPNGTSMTDLPGKSWAKPAVWTDRDKFEAAAKNAATKAAALDAALKGGDMSAITAAFGDMGKNGCGGCHETFREKKPS